MTGTQAMGNVAGIRDVSTAARIGAIVASSSGNLVEWFDFYVYAFGAIFFAAAFFPGGDATSQLLSTAGVFAAGFLMRPIGGWFFGRLADRVGRRASMMLSVLMMCGGSLVIACLPTHATIGVWAPLLLVVCRLVQGLSVGGEYGTSATYMSEVAVEGRRGFYSSFQYVTLIGGQLLAVMTMLVLQQFLDASEMQAWGWRVPFAIGACLALVALYLRRALPETTTENDRDDKEAGSLRALFATSLFPFIQVVGLTAGGSLAFYTFTTYMQKYLVNSAHMNATTASAVMTGVLFAYMVIQPLFGGLSDLVGRRPLLIAFGGLMVFLTVPLLTAIRDTGASPWMAFLLILAALSIVSLYTSISGLFKAELFPTRVRALGVGLSYAIGNALFGGSAEYVALWFKQAGHEDWFYWYVTALCALALGMVLWMRDSRQSGFLQDRI
jgi:MHS family alpha-ketoglutarate permease-like MFS transporter